jgi:hypothetical protein
MVIEFRRGQQWKKITSVVVPRGTAAPILLKWLVSRDVPTCAPSFSNGNIIPIPIPIPLFPFCLSTIRKSGVLVKASRPPLEMLYFDWFPFSHIWSTARWRGIYVHWITVPNMCHNGLFLTSHSSPPSRRSSGSLLDHNFHRYDSSQHHYYHSESNSIRWSKFHPIYKVIGVE